MRASILAPLSLAAAAALFLLTLPFSGAWWASLLRAFAEAAMIGGIADWFAVVALFRHPLGIPIPHTAIIPRHREKLTHGAADLVQNMWLNKATLQERIRSWDLASSVGTALAAPANGALLLRLLRDAMTLVLREADLRALSDWIAAQLRRELRGEMLSHWVRDLSVRALEEQWHRNAAVALRDKGIPLLRSARVQEEIARKLEFVAGTYASTSLRRVGRWIAESINMVNYEDLARALTDVLCDELDRLATDPAHSLVRHAEDWMRDFPERLSADEAFHTTVEAWLDVLIPPKRMEQILGRGRDALLHDLHADNSMVLGVVTEWVRRGSERLRTDAASREAFNSWMQERIAALIERHHGAIGDLVRHNLDRLDSRELTRQIEAKVGADLQYIRVNGALVGGLVGACLHLLTTGLL